MLSGPGGVTRRVLVRAAGIFPPGSPFYRSPEDPRVKKLFAAFVALFVVCIFQPALAANAASKNARGTGEVIVYNWSEYIPEDVLDDFTKETGIKVIYSTYESNEAMYAKLKIMRGKSYDVVCPSTYFIDLMVRDGLLQKLDHSKLPNMKNLDPKLMDQAYDPGNLHSMPYMWGSMGMLVNTKYVKDGQAGKWADLLKPEFKDKIMLSDDLRDTMGVALKAVGKSVNSQNEEDVKAAYEFLSKLRPSVRVFDVTASKQAFVSEEVIIGTIWNGDAMVAIEENSDLKFIYPEEGVALWVDSFGIPAGAPNVENAHIFINFMLRPDIAKRCMEEYQYSTPNLAALGMLDEELRENRVINPNAEDLKNSEMLTGLGQAQQVYERYWERIKTQR